MVKPTNKEVSMGARGRKPATELATVTTLETARPEAPVELSAEERIEWDKVVNRLPVDWFPSETHAMLAQYCKHCSAAKMVAFLISEMQLRPHAADEIAEDATAFFDLDAYDKLLKMQERESRAMIASARSLRFTLQATIDPEARKAKRQSSKKAWEV